MTRRRKSKSLGGRPTKLTKALADRLVGLVKKGNYVITAAAACGVDRKTYYNWVERGRKSIGLEIIDPEEVPFADFAARIDVASATAEIAAVADVRARKDQWAASMTYLERRFPDRWGRRQRVEHSGPQGGAIALRAVTDDYIRGASKEQLRAIAEGRALPQGTDGGEVHPSDEGGSDRGPERPEGEG